MYGGPQQGWPGQYGETANLRHLLQLQDPGQAARQVLERVNRLHNSDHDLHELCETLPDILTKLFGSGMRHPTQKRLADDVWSGVGWADYGFHTSSDSDVVRQLLSSKSQPNPKVGLLARCLDIVRKTPPPCLFKFRYDKLPVLTRDVISHCFLTLDSSSACRLSPATGLVVFKERLWRCWCSEVTKSSRFRPSIPSSIFSFASADS